MLVQRDALGVTMTSTKNGTNDSAAKEMRYRIKHVRFAKYACLSPSNENLFPINRNSKSVNIEMVFGEL